MPRNTSLFDFLHVEVILRSSGQYIKSVKPRTSLPCSLSNGQVTVSSDTDKAGLLNEFFTSCFNPVVQPPSYSELPQCAESDAADYDITQDKVYVRLRMIKSHSAAGPDGITSWMLFTFADVISPSLVSLYNLSIYNRADSD